MMNRRDFLRRSASALAVGGLASGLPFGAFRRALAAGAAPGDKKLLLIFLRGGNDALNTIIPHGDADYSHPALRPTLHVDSSESIDLGNGYAHLHPSLAKLQTIHTAGELASIQRVGYAGQSHSHFSSQQFWETADPGNLTRTDGFVARFVQATEPDAPFYAVNVAKHMQRAFLGEQVIAHVPGSQVGSFGGTGTLFSTVMGEPGEDGAGLLGVCSTPASGAAYDEKVRRTGLLTGETLDLLGALLPYVAPPSFYPVDPADLAAEGLPNKAWAIDFFQKLQVAVQLLKETDARIAGVELHGFDDHQAQGALTGNHPDHLHVLAHGMRSVALDTQTDLWSDLLMLTLSEFGRTSMENDSGGTDHGESTAVFAAGGAVIGGVYNCDAATWPSGATLFSENAKYVAHATDFRAVYGEVLTKHLGATPAALAAAIPGWAGLTGPAFDPLGFLV